MFKEHRYREELLHWIWETSRIENRYIATVDQEPVSIFDVGTPNKTDGPDFLNARIQIGELQWFGDVEIHWDTKDWIHHGHSKDPNYNRVVLHVVWNDTGTEEIFREDGSRIPTLSLRGKLSGALNSFLDQYQKPGSLPCSGNFSYISRDAFVQQLQKAEKEYFEQKVNDLLTFWDPTKPPSQAWLNMLALGMFDGLGIAHNRQPMRQLCQALIPLISGIDSESDLQRLARKHAAFETGASIWTHKGSRPVNHPRARIKQAASFLWLLHQKPFKRWLNSEPQYLWEELNAQISARTGLGEQRKDILFGTVWLPSFFILGNTFSSTTLKTKASELWKNHRARIPDSLLRPFKELDIPSRTYNNSLGSIYQLRTYCKPRHCKSCKVFKSVISS